MKRSANYSTAKGRVDAGAAGLARLETPNQGLRPSLTQTRAGTRRLKQPAAELSDKEPTADDIGHNFLLLLRVYGQMMRIIYFSVY